MNTQPTLPTKCTWAVIGGSGLYHMSGLVNALEYDLSTPFGKPSAPLVVGTLEGQSIAFLARHGIGHHLTPSEVNYRANIFALKSIGVERIISISACGSLREDYAPGDLVVPDQLLDLTRDRKRTFFGDGLVAHVGVADPFCPELSEQVLQASQAVGAVVHRGGSFVTIEGPRFSTRAESNVFRTWGMAIIGMTTSPEAFLAREAEICYAVMAHVTDYDVWHIEAEPVSVEAVITVLNRNTQIAQDAIRHLLLNSQPERTCNCSSSLKNALITQPAVIPADTRARLDLLVGKYLK
jgi:5'-methylthioadenosine phosphorylase